MYKEVIGKLEEDLKYEKLATLTIERYKTRSQEYLKWLKRKKKPLKNTSLNEIKAFLLWKDKNNKTAKPLSLNTTNLIKASLRSLYNSIGKPEIASLIKGQKPADTIPKTLSKEEIKTVLLFVRNDLYKEVWKNEQAYYFISFLYQTGARIGEIAKLTKSDFDFSRNVVKLGSKKSEFLRKLNKVWILDFKNWLRSESKAKFVFTNKEGKPLAKRTLQWIIEKACFRALNKKYSAHRFRASCITHRLEEGEEFFSVSSNFHVDMKTTKRYVGATARSLDKAVNPFETL